jgi:hypothetical protein
VHRDLSEVREPAMGGDGVGKPSGGGNGKRKGPGCEQQPQVRRTPKERPVCLELAG